MADYYTEASFIIPCTDTQADIALAALKHLENEESAYLNMMAKKEIKAEKNSTPDKMSEIIRHCLENHPEQGREHLTIELDWEFSAIKNKKGIWLHNDECINTEHAAIFAQAVLNAFNIDEAVVINASHTCSRPVVDSFGGHSVVITKNSMRFHGLHDFVDAELKAHHNKESHYLCEITEVNGEYEYPDKFLMICRGEEDPDEKLEGIFNSYRGEGYKNPDDEYTVWFSDNLAAKNPEYTKITPMEYKTMSAYLTVL